jgi:hypothetical protein
LSSTPGGAGSWLRMRWGPGRPPHRHPGSSRTGRRRTRLFRTYQRQIERLTAVLDNPALERLCSISKRFAQDADFPHSFCDLLFSKCIRSGRAAQGRQQAAGAGKAERANGLQTGSEPSKAPSYGPATA